MSYFGMLSGALASSSTGSGQEGLSLTSTPAVAIYCGIGVLAIGLGAALHYCGKSLEAEGKNDPPIGKKKDNPPSGSSSSEPLLTDISSGLPSAPSSTPNLPQNTP